MSRRIHQPYVAISILLRLLSGLKNFKVYPFLFLVGDTKLKAVVQKAESSAVVFGSREDDASSSRYLSETAISGDQSREALVPMIVKSMESIPSSELGTVTDHLLNDYIPDNVPLGNQLTPNKAEPDKEDKQIVAFHMKHNVEPMAVPHNAIWSNASN